MKVNYAVYIGLFFAVLSFGLTSCVKDDEECKVCHYIEDDGSKVSMGELCGNEYKTVESSGFISSTGYHEVTCE